MEERTRKSGGSINPLGSRYAIHPMGRLPDKDLFYSHFLSLLFLERIVGI